MLLFFFFAALMLALVRYAYKSARRRCHAFFAIAARRAIDAACTTLDAVCAALLARRVGHESRVDAVMRDAALAIDA